MSIYTPMWMGKTDDAAELLQGRNGPCFKLQLKLCFQSRDEMKFDDGKCLGT